MAPDENPPEPNSICPDDIAIVINGTALMTRPKKPNPRISEIRLMLKELTWSIVDTPEKEHGKTVVLEGSDVLYTGKEIFVGLRKHGTNIEGALVVGRVFADLPVIPITISTNLPLKYYVSVASDGVLTTTNEPEAINIRTVSVSFSKKTLEGVFPMSHSKSLKG